MNRKTFIERIRGVRKVKESTALTHWQRLKRIWNLIHPNAPPGKEFILPEDSSWLFDPACLDEFSPVVQRNNTTSACIYHQLVGNNQLAKVFGDYLELNSELQKTLQKQREFKPTPKQQHRTVTRKQLLDFTKELDIEVKLRRVYHPDTGVWTSAQRQVAQRQLIGYLFVIQPPLRNDYSTVFVETPQTIDNHSNVIVQRKRQLYVILRDYKNVYSQGVKTIPLVKKVNTLMKRFIEKGHIAIGEPLIVTPGNKPYTRNGFGRCVQRIFKERFGIPIGTTDLRRLFVSHTFKDSIPMLQNLETIAEMMCHSGQEQRSSYLKND